jgi:hypothetical protein
VKPYRFHREARAEYRAALAWYAARSLDAADGFADGVTIGIRGRRGPVGWTFACAVCGAIRTSSCTSSAIRRS